jgi:hypothetical protein
MFIAIAPFFVLQAHSLPANIRLEWKDLTLSNTLAYNLFVLMMVVKGFIVLAPVVCLWSSFRETLL